MTTFCLRFTSSGSFLCCTTTTAPAAFLRLPGGLFSPAYTAPAQTGVITGFLPLPACLFLGWFKPATACHVLLVFTHACYAFLPHTMHICRRKEGSFYLPACFTTCSAFSLRSAVSLTLPTYHHLPFGFYLYHRPPAFVLRSGFPVRSLPVWLGFHHYFAFLHRLLPCHVFPRSFWLVPHHSCLHCCCQQHRSARTLLLLTCQFAAPRRCYTLPCWRHPDLKAANAGTPHTWPRCCLPYYRLQGHVFVLRLPATTLYHRFTQYTRILPAATFYTYSSAGFLHLRSEFSIRLVLYLPFNSS